MDIKLTMDGPLHIRVETENKQFLKDLGRHLEDYVKDYFFMPAFKSGVWNGKKKFFNAATNTFPYGLLNEVLSFKKNFFNELDLTADDEVKKLFTGDLRIENFDLDLTPYPFQKDCIETILVRQRGIIRSATASGKSLVIAYVIKEIVEKTKGKVLVIVPSKSLVKQFDDDFLSYGDWFKDKVGLVYAGAGDRLDWSKSIVLTTWQSLSKNKAKLNDFVGIVCDEVHTAKAKVLSDILSKATKAAFRMGFTGTMPGNRVEELSVKSFLGPVWREYKSGDLANEGYISSCKVKLKKLYYKDRPRGTYIEVADQVFQNPFRLSVIENIVRDRDRSVLILVGKVEKEGLVLKEYLENRLAGKTVVFLSGKDKVDVRNEWRKECNERQDVVLIATYGIMSTGINIPSLKYMILGSSYKSKIRILQSIGRTLRKHQDKTEGAVIFDLCDMVESMEPQENGKDKKKKYFEKHGEKRIKMYEQDGFDVEIEELRE